MKPEVDHFEEVQRKVTVVAVPKDVITEAGIILDASGGLVDGMKVSKDGQTILIPQPTMLDSDSLNWSWTRKHLILFTIAFGALTADFTSASGTTTIVLQGVEWHMSPNSVNHAGNLNVLMMGLGGMIWVPMTRVWGRAPVLFWTTFIGLFFSIGSAVTSDWLTFYAMRATMGLFLTAPQTISIAFLKDMFFFHERAKKIGVWSTLYISSPYIGPCFANFLVDATGNWKHVFWLNSGVIALQLIFIVAFIDETYFRRDIPSGDQPRRVKGFLGRLSRVLGIWQIRVHNDYFEPFFRSWRIFATVVTRPALVLVLIHYLLVFAWAVGINITVVVLFSTPAAFGGYGYSSKSLGLLYLTPIVAVFIGEAFGHFFNEWIARRYIGRHKGVYEAEARLPTIYIALVFMVAGLVLIGQSLEKLLPVVAVVFGWGLMTFGIMLSSVAVTAYALDAYPTVPAEVGGWINFMRVAGGFSVGYFQQPWGDRVGFATSFGTQAAIVAFSGVFVVAAHVYGHRLRARFGQIE
ncbi:major facilitator superfamily domain-containing protein [Boeremia exigua]|uniref:major facilitator superfamily domain-containing protein n=1 Tax=Boeremia exigua TaxID=749465 RepID=UPI001E8DCE23|nr:major facilitator superfamily domain-containing protein [Boeremia exigua]KAH6642757.1 major facilitator superfamily domain-containing protein [Boeremia exigua]